MKTVCCCLAAAFTVAGGLQAQTLLNGSFENPAYSSGSVTPGSGDNWTTSGSVSVYTNASGFGYTSYGQQWVDLDPNGTDAQTLTGTFALDATYTLSLMAADVGTAGSPANERLTVTLSGGATGSQTIAVPRGGRNANSPFNFVTCSLAFTPTSNALITVTLTNPSSTAVAVDDVQLSVPEPSIWALLAGGAGLLMLVTRRRKAA